MTLSLKAISMSCSALLGGSMLFVGLVHMADPSYGGAFLQMMSSVSPGADTAPTIGRVLLGTVYGLVEGAVAGCVFGWLYSLLSHGSPVANAEHR